MHPAFVTQTCERGERPRSKTGIEGVRARTVGNKDDEGHFR
jgi:hypothetical protein